MSLRRRGRAHRILGAWPEHDLVGDVGPFEHIPPRRLLERLSLETVLPFERGDLLLAGRIFGSPTTTDRVALALSLSGAGFLLADSVGAAFRESCLHAGLPVLAMPGLQASIREGDDVIVDAESGTIENVTTHRVMVAPALTPTELRRALQAPSLQWYGVARPPVDPDVLEATQSRALIPVQKAPTGEP